jgi:ABC-2 type transport system permease protein
MNTWILAAREPLPLARTLRAYLAEARFETLAALRTPGFALPFLLAPLGIYLLFGVVINANSGKFSPYGEAIHDYLFVGFEVMAAMMPGIFCGVILATERAGRLLQLKRSLPQPPGATVLAKMLMSMALGAIGISLVAVAAMMAGRIHLSPAQVATIWAVTVAGTIPFCAIGLLIGALASASAAPAWGNLVCLPMMTLSGLFVPLPAALEKWVLLWPAFHLDQLALAAAGVDRFRFVPPALAGAVLVGVTVLCGGIAIRRLARVG